MKEIFERVSIREYSKRKIEKEKVEKLLFAGMVAPCARNQRAWEFLVCDDEILLNKIGNGAPYHKMAKEAPLAILVLCNKDKITSPTYIDQDLAVATENILLEVTHLGLGAVWLGVAQNEERMSYLKDVFNIPDNYYVFNVIVIGYPLKEVKKERIYDENIIHHNCLGKKYE